ncbi:hypothetical protein HII36_30125 [Nonomuraea sp. NN258]|uniref:hypothetical protein n=1 Tax=Nonomuraea antri TaxID=2730852 RepID=UPI00156A24E6|nr:hypothetical protein [Nonomuraea antri]NRQ36059.1 hypothetical protein [Nonomuraea antri]
MGHRFRAPAVLGGATVHAPGLVLDGRGHLRLLYRDAVTGTLVQRVGAGDGVWSVPTDTGVPLDGSPVPARAGDGRVAVFFRGAAGDGLWMLLEEPAGGPPGWQPPVLLDPALSGRPVVGFDGAGRMEVFYAGTGGALWHVWSGDHGLDKLGRDVFGGSDVQGLAVTTTHSGRQALFHTDREGRLWLIEQRAAGGAWGELLHLASGVTGSFAAAPAPGDGLQVVYHQAADGLLHHLSMAEAGEWNLRQPVWAEAGRWSFALHRPRGRATLAWIGRRDGDPRLWVGEQHAPGGPEWTFTGGSGVCPATGLATALDAAGDVVVAWGLPSPGPAGKPGGVGATTVAFA